jgi:hypothetical protein
MSVEEQRDPSFFSGHRLDRVIHPFYQRLLAYVLIVVAGTIGFVRTQQISDRNTREGVQRIIGFRNEDRTNAIRSCNDSLTNRQTIRALLDDSLVSQQQSSAQFLSSAPADLRPLIQKSLETSKTFHDQQIAKLSLPNCAALPRPSPTLNG